MCSSTNGRMPQHFEHGNIATVVFSSELKLQLLCYHAQKLAHAPIGITILYLLARIYIIMGEGGAGGERDDYEQLQWDRCLGFTSREGSEEKGSDTPYHQQTALTDY